MALFNWLGNNLTGGGQPVNDSGLFGGMTGLQSGLTQLGTGLMQAGAPSTQPMNIGSTLGQGAQAFMQGFQDQVDYDQQNDDETATDSPSASLSGMGPDMIPRGGQSWYDSLVNWW